MPGLRIDVFLRNAAAYPFRNLGGMIHIGLRQEYDKFLAAVAGHRIAHPQMRLNKVGDIHQHLVARLMAVGVVDALEFVDVEEHAGQRMIVPASVPQPAL